MSLKELETKFAQIANNPNETARLWKEQTGKRVIGCAGLDIPEVVIEAAGMIPFVLLDREKEITSAGSHFQTHICGYVRSVVQQVLNTELSFVDAFVFADCCHEIRMGFDLIPHIATAEQFKTSQFFYFPPVLHDKIANDYLKDEFDLFKKHIESVAGKTIEEKDFATAIATFNENRRLLMKLYDIRRNNPGIISAVFVSNVVAASMCMPKSEHSKLLQELIKELEKKITDGFVKSTAVPVIISGSLCEPCDVEILEAAENFGGVIVDDDLYVGSRYFNTLFDENVPGMDAVFNAYVNRVSPCPTRYENRDIGTYQIEMVKNSNAKGVINVIVKHCEPHYYAYFTAHQNLMKANMPELLLEMELENSQSGQIKTRMQSFFETLEV